MKKTPLKRGNYRLKRKTFQKKMRERSLEEGLLNMRLFGFFTDVWLSTPRDLWKCESCGNSLEEPPRSYNFDHLIEKSKRPDLALERDNIFLCCLDCHTKKTNGFPTEKHKEAIEDAKKRFGIS